MRLERRSMGASLLLLPGASHFSFLWHRGPAGLRGLIIRLPILRSLGIVRRFGRVSVPFTNEQCRIQERKVKNRKSPYLEVISSLQ